MNTKDFISQNKLIVVCRRVYGDDLLRLAEALHKGGINLMELTFDQVDSECMMKTPYNISSLVSHFGSEMQFGAGTVLSKDQVKAAADGGAKYIISPNTDINVIQTTKKLGLVSIPGAATPTEILTAHNNGADFVKLFPAGTLGFKYIKDILAPISHVKFVANGGVTEDNYGEYLKLGFAGAGVSGRLTDKALISSGNFDEFTRRASLFSKISSQY